MRARRQRRRRQAPSAAGRRRRAERSGAVEDFDRGPGFRRAAQRRCRVVGQVVGRRQAGVRCRIEIDRRRRRRRSVGRRGDLNESRIGDQRRQGDALEGDLHVGGAVAVDVDLEDLGSVVEPRLGIADAAEGVGVCAEEAESAVQQAVEDDVLVDIGRLEILDHVAGTGGGVGDRLVDKGVVAAGKADLVADQNIRAATAGDRVVALKPDQLVGGAVAGQHVVAEAAFKVLNAGERINAGAAGRRARTDQRIGRRRKIDRHRRRRVVEGRRIRTGAAVNDVVAEAAVEEVVAAEAGDRVVAGVAEQRVVAGAADDGIDAVGAGDRRRTRRRRRQRQAAGGIRRHIEAEGLQRTVLVEVELHRRERRRQLILDRRRMRGVGIVHIGKRHIAARRIRLRALDEELRADHQLIDAAARGDGVVARRRQEHIVAQRALDQRVVAGAAGQRIDDLVHRQRHRRGGGRILGPVIALPGKAHRAVEVGVGNKLQVGQFGQRDLLVHRYRRRPVVQCQVAVRRQRHHLDLDQGVEAIGVAEVVREVGLRERQCRVLVERRRREVRYRRRGVGDRRGDEVAGRQRAGDRHADRDVFRVKRVAVAVEVDRQHAARQDRRGMAGRERPGTLEGEAAALNQPVQLDLVRAGDEVADHVAGAAGRVRRRRVAEDVVAAAAGEDVRTGAAEQDIVARLTLQRIVTAAAAQRVGAGTGLQDVGVGVAGQLVGAGAGTEVLDVEQRVGAAEAVADGHRCRRIVRPQVGDDALRRVRIPGPVAAARTAVDVVVAAARPELLAQRVAADDEVVVGRAADLVDAADQRIGAAEAVRRLACQYARPAHRLRRRRQVDHDPRRRVDIVHAIRPGAAGDRVVAAEVAEADEAAVRADEDVVARRAANLQAARTRYVGDIQQRVGAIGALADLARRQRHVDVDRARQIAVVDRVEALAGLEIDGVVACPGLDPVAVAEGRAVAGLDQVIARTADQHVVAGAADQRVGAAFAQ